MVNIEISNTDDTIDVRDVISRVEELERDIDDLEDISEDDSLTDELSSLTSLLREAKDNGGDHEWRGDWYPVTLIRDSYFEEYARELAEDIGAINADARWPNNCINWEQAALELRSDYTAIIFDSVTYWCR